jgi:hypothetical protein
MEVARVYQRLRLYNGLMGLLHLAQGVAILLLSNSFTLPINTTFLSYMPQTGRLAPVADTIINIPLGPMIAVFLFLSALAHFIVTTFAFRWYAANLQRGVNYARWYEYSLSASVMIVLIAMLCGVYDLGALILAFELTAVMNLCGLIMEIHNRLTARTDWTSYIVGCIAGVAPWAVIAIYFFGSLSQAEGGVPVLSMPYCPPCSSSSSASP